jgi:hypothetical protein
MKEEVVILPVENKWIFDEMGTLSDKVTGEDVFWNPVNIDREPQFAALFVKGEKAVRAIAEIDLQRSDLKNGKVLLKNPICVEIPIRFGRDKLEGIRYTTFRKLITHKNTDHI